MKNVKGIYILSMLIFGSIGLYAKNINLSSGQLAMARGIIGSIFLLAVCPVIKQKLSWKAIRPNIWLLILSGTAIGFNWILLFEAYKYTTIANATLSYYFAPVFVMLLSPLFLKERLTVIRFLCTLGAVVGMFFVVGIGRETAENHLVGITYGLSAAVLYAGVVIMNKFLKGLSGIETTVIQLGAASLVLTPYILMTETITIFTMDAKSLLLTIIVGVVNTGVAYLLYFMAMRKLNSQTIAIYSYIDPISAIILSSVLLGEQMTLLQILGGILILGATFLSEWTGRKKMQPHYDAGTSSGT